MSKNSSDKSKFSIESSSEEQESSEKAKKELPTEPVEVLETTHIYFSEKFKTFRLFCGNSLYSFCITSEFTLQHLYFGKAFASGRGINIDLRYLSAHVGQTNIYSPENTNNPERKSGLLTVETKPFEPPIIEVPYHQECGFGRTLPYRGEDLKPDTFEEDKAWLFSTKKGLGKWGDDSNYSKHGRPSAAAERENSDSRKELPRNFDRLSHAAVARLKLGSMKQPAVKMTTDQLKAFGEQEEDIEAITSVPTSQREKELATGRPDFSNTYDSIGYDSDVLPKSLPPTTEQIEAYQGAINALKSGSSVQREFTEVNEKNGDTGKTDDLPFWDDVVIDAETAESISLKASNHSADENSDGAAESSPESISGCRSTSDELTFATVVGGDVPLVGGEVSRNADIRTDELSQTIPPAVELFNSPKYSNAILESQACGISDVRKIVESIEWDEFQQDTSPKDLSPHLETTALSAKQPSKYVARRLFDRDLGKIGKNMLCLEYSDYGTGDFRPPSISVADSYDGSIISSLKYKTHHIFAGKLSMPDGLPGIHAWSENEASTLVVILEDDYTGLEVHIIYVAMHNFDVITRRAVYKNMDCRCKKTSDDRTGADQTFTQSDVPLEEKGGKLEKAGEFGFAYSSDSQTYAGQNSGRNLDEPHLRSASYKIIQKACSLTLDFEAGVESHHVTELSGSWGNERNIVTHEMKSGTLSFGSTQGQSGHSHNPFIAISSGEPNESSGDIVAISLLYSGSFTIEADVDPVGKLRVNAGINPITMQWRLNRGEAFNTPEAVLIRSSDGLGGMSRTLHRLIRERLVTKPTWALENPPISLNTWEACRFNVNHEKVVDLACRGERLGIDLIVVDDGWFERRSTDLSSLGDWNLDKSKFPRGLGALAKDVNTAGLKLGLYLEPEMVSFDSKLSRDNDTFWLRSHTSASNRTEKYQMVLDLSNKEVVEHLYVAISNLLRSANIEYIKWDMRSPLTDVYSLRKADATTGTLPIGKFVPELKVGVYQGETAHRYILGLYNLLHRISSEFPGVLIESSASGGGRFDLGMLYFTPQVLTSANSDSAIRLKIQYGTSIAYPIGTMGVRVTCVPSSMTGASMGARYRGFAAMCGTFGFEHDLQNITEKEERLFKEQAAIYHKYSDIILSGDLYRLWNPFKSSHCAFQFISEKTDSIVFAFRGSKFKRMQEPHLLILQGLISGAEYEVCELLPRTSALKLMCTSSSVQTAAPLYQLGFSSVRILGQILMSVGIPIRFFSIDDCTMFYIKRIKLKGAP